MNAANWLKRNTLVSMTEWEGDPLGIVQEIKVWPYWWMVHAQLESVLKNEALNYEIQTDHSIHVRWADFVLIKKDERMCQLVDFVFQWTIE